MTLTTDGTTDRDAPAALVTASVAYDGDPSCIAEARDFAAAFLDRVSEQRDREVSSRAFAVTQLVVSELITNVCKYAPGPCVLDLRLAGRMVEISVWDSDPVLPLPRTPEPGRVGQHGLEIVLAVSQGYEVRREPVGKRTRALIALQDDPAGAPAGMTPGVD
ncbi:ATP-binding protein [Streptomyces solincola]|uniref:ATP-binding protein n=1 Tax=Streptomyces solincola TaxID=2100817 RepID=A0A2S9PR49_9ACTN|nr:MULTISPECIES: ATP-binding protein [Streptomyces]PRH76884.1 ATP-binding protein [Streptomyces solincola]